MHYKPANKDHNLPFDPFKACVGPRPIGWISTVSKDGVCNLAPFSQFNNLSYDPPLIMLAVTQQGVEASEIRRKDTTKNIEDTGFFAYNIVPYNLKDAMNQTAAPVPPEVDEFELAGLTKEDCIDIPCKMVAESPIKMECKLVQTIRIPGNTPKTTVDILIGEVIHVHIADEFITSEGKVDIVKIRPLGRLGYFDYTTVDSVFSMRMPVSNPKQLAAMEGRS